MDGIKQDPGGEIPGSLNEGTCKTAAVSMELLVWHLAMESVHWACYEMLSQSSGWSVGAAYVPTAAAVFAAFAAVLGTSLAAEEANC